MLPFCELPVCDCWFLAMEPIIMEAQPDPPLQLQRHAPHEIEAW